MAGDARVGPYRIVRLVNRGGQGSVFLGYDQRLQRRVAIKIYTLPARRGERKRLLQEAQILASIQSPKVVQIHDVIESSEHLALVMEYVPGCDLEDFLGRVRPCLASILTIATDVAGALTVARHQHIVHGDLKAGNVLIAENGRVKLTDFGISQRGGGPVAGDFSCGSLSALSPEQYLGRPADSRSDLFALGCLLYRMLTGEHPFVRAGQLDARLLLERAPPPLRQRLLAGEVAAPPELLELVDSLLCKEPQDRPANTRSVRQVLRRVARQVPLAAADSLLAEARPCFRRESTQDIPPEIPAGLGREARSRLPGPPGLRRWLVAGNWRLRGATAAVACVLAIASLALLLRPAVTSLHIAAPALRVASDAPLPAEISARWLVDQVTAAAAEQLGPLQVTGPVGLAPPTTLRTDSFGAGDRQRPREQLELGLRCSDLLCVFAVTRRWQGRRADQQALLFPDMPAEQWRSIIRATTRALYR